MIWELKCVECSKMSDEEEIFWTFNITPTAIRIFVSFLWSSRRHLETVHPDRESAKASNVTVIKKQWKCTTCMAVSENLQAMLSYVKEVHFTKEGHSILNTPVKCISYTCQKKFFKYKSVKCMKRHELHNEIHLVFEDDDNTKTGIKHED